MSFWRQLGILLWKNFLIRRRQKVWVIVEITWPLILFLILVWVRTRDLTERNPECHYSPKALPSAGFLPFLQSYFCTVKNNCQRSPHDDDNVGKVNSADNSMLSQVAGYIQQMLGDHETGRNVEAVLKDVEQLVALTKKFEPGDAIPGDVPMHLLFKSNDSFITDCSTDSVSAETCRLWLQSTLKPRFFVELLSAMSTMKPPDEMDILLGGLPDLSPIKEKLYCNYTILELTTESDSEEHLKKIGTEICSMSNWDSFWYSQAMSNIDTASGSIQMVIVWRNITGYSASFTDLFQMGSLAYKMYNDLKKEPFNYIFDILNSDSVNESYSKNSTKEEVISKFSCGQLTNGFGSMLGGKKTPEQHMREKFQKEIDRPPGEPPKKETVFRASNSEHFQNMANLGTNASSTICDRFVLNRETDAMCYAWLRSIRMPPDFAAQLFVLLRGYILMTPPSNVTLKLASKMQTWLRGVEFLKDSVLDFALNAAVYQNALANSSLAETVKVWLNITKNINSTSPLPDEITEKLSVVESFFVYSNDSSAILPKLRHFIRPAAIFVECFMTERFAFVTNETVMEEEAMCLQEYNKFFSGIYLNVTEEDDELPPMTSYKIRMAGFLVDASGVIADRYWNPRPRDRPFLDLKYLYYGFSFLQDGIERAIIELQTNVSYDSGVYAQQFPTVCYQIDAFVRAIERLLPLLMIMAWVCSAALIIKNIVYEKELRLKEFMRVMGLGDLVHWVAWFIQCFTILQVSVILFVLIAKYGHVIKQSDPTVLFVFVMVFTVATICQCFLISTFFNKANLAAACGAVIYFVLYIPYPALMRFVGQMSYTGRIASCLLSQVAFGWGCAYLATWEDTGIGVQWSNVNKSPYGTSDDFNLLTSIYIMLIDSAIYLVLTWYIEAVFPGEYGIPRSYYFFLTKSYWCSDAGTNPTPNDDLDETEPGLKAHMEAEPTHLPMGVSVRHLKKIYSNGKVALSGLSLNFYESQITSFLGHNGAGKTTTLSIITGLFPPSQGTVLVNGKDVRTRMHEIRQSLGMCPQHNILFGMLTVYEQLVFYASLKGVPMRQASHEVKAVIDELGLSAKANEQAQNLSGGTQRRLAIAVAFIGGSKTVILDEPTAGVDPYARRYIWDLLLRKKEGRTIILSTHHMDEADVLGDRIAIISAGRLKCCGSSMFLKKCFGSGYHLTLVVDNETKNKNNGVLTADTGEEQGQQSDGSNHGSCEDIAQDIQLKSRSDKNSMGCRTKESVTETPIIKNFHKNIDIDNVTKFITSVLPGAVLLECIGREARYSLPSEDLDLLHKFFVHFEADAKKIGIAAYGVSETKLEEIFLKVVGEEDVEQSINYRTSSFWRLFRERFLRLFIAKRKRYPVDDRNLMDSSGAVANAVTKNVNTADDEIDKSPNIFLSNDQINHRQDIVTVIKRQMPTLLKKRLIHFSRNVKGAFCEIILPILTVALTMYLLGFQPPQPVAQRSLPLLPWVYRAPNYVFYSLDNPAPDVHSSGERYLKALVDPPGLSVRCANNQPYSSVFPCEPLATGDDTVTPVVDILPMYDNTTEGGTCYCNDRSYYVCPVNSYEPEPPVELMNSTDFLVNATGHNITKWLLMTAKKYRKQRYAGFSLGELNIAAQQDINWSNVDYNILYLADVINNFTKDVGIDWSSSRSTRWKPIGQSNATFWISTNITEKLRMLLSGMEVRSNVKIWFNNQGWAAIPIYTNVLNNAILRASLGPNADPSDYGIVAHNHPMNISVSSQAEQFAFGFNQALLLFEAVMIILAFSVVPASFVLFIIEENISHAKHLQFITGVRPILYWVSNFVWDMTNFLIPLVGCIIIFVIFNDQAYIGSFSSVAATFLLFLTYGFAIIPYMYACTFVFRIPSLAFIILTMANAFFGWITTTTTATFEALSQEDAELAYINEILMTVFLLLPQFCLGRGLLNMKKAYFLYLGDAYVLGNDLPWPSPFAWDVIGRNLLCLLVEGLLGCALVLLLEYRQSICGRDGKGSDAPLTNDDEDVGEERSQILATSPRASQYTLLIKNLSKVFGNGGCRKADSLHAVNRLCFGVKRGECFGLLGVNGAGKTTTFTMLTGKTAVTAGDAFVKGFSIVSQMNKVCQLIGYCPQFDALHDLLTAREHLRFYARLRGVKQEYIEGVVNATINHLGLKQHADRLSSTYSGGNKRKLSTGIALIGNPAVILLDEPTTGMDPKARRFLWNRITEIIRDGRRSVVLTSHSMEECEALCNRIGIMVNGTLRCLGSVQHLKYRFGKGYALTLKIGGVKPNTEPALHFVREHFPSAVLKEQHFGQLRFQLPPESKSLADIFDCMVKAQKLQLIEDYSLSQTTLEQVFLGFAQAQGNPSADTDALERNGSVDGVANAS